MLWINIVDLDLARMHFYRGKLFNRLQTCSKRFAQDTNS